MLNFVLGKHEANVSITKQIICLLMAAVKGPLWGRQKPEALLHPWSSWLLSSAE